MGDGLVERECPTCGTSYVADPKRLRFGRQTTCSRACSYKRRGAMLEDKVTFLCAVCGEQVERSPAQIKSKHGGQFCSRVCHYAGRATGATRRVVTRPYVIPSDVRARASAVLRDNNRLRKERGEYGHTDASRAKLSIATARALAEGKVGRPSKVENKVAAELDALGVPYVRQFAIRNADGTFAMVMDFWLTDISVDLEVNGTYWHADPRVYAVPTAGIQERAVARYRRKVDALAARGIRVVEVWELDVKKSPSQAVAEAYARALSG